MSVHKEETESGRRRRRWWCDLGFTCVPAKQARNLAYNFMLAVLAGACPHVSTYVSYRTTVILHGRTNPRLARREKQSVFRVANGGDCSFAGLRLVT